MELRAKLAILADAAKYDASCASSGAEKRDSRGGGLGSTEGIGICHAYAPDGRLVFASSRGYLDGHAIGRTGPTRTPASLAPSACLLDGDVLLPAPGLSWPPTAARPDAVRLRRARIARVVKALERLGYYLLLLAMVAFAVALTTGFAGFWVWVCVVSLLVAVVVLPLPIIIGYGIRAAEREDRTAV